MADSAVRFGWKHWPFRAIASGWRQWEERTTTAWSSGTWRQGRPSAAPPQLIILVSSSSLVGLLAADAAAGRTVKFAKHDEFLLITAGEGNLRVWDFDLANRKIRPTDCNLGKLQRSVNYVYVDDHDEYMYAGTTTGDVLKVNLRTKLFKHVGPKTRLSQGANCINMTPDGDLLVGSGDGTIATLDAETLKMKQSTRIEGGGITCMAPHVSKQ
eukprot:766747-Hanusia_phi.AAC.1